MAYFKITQNKKGELQAKIQVSGKDIETGNPKLYTKRIYNTDNLTEAKFRKFAEKQAIAFEEEIDKSYEEHTHAVRNKIPTFKELADEWTGNVKNTLSLSYYNIVTNACNKFSLYLEQIGLDKKPITEIRVRDIQLFLNSFSEIKPNKATAKLIKALPDKVKANQLDREGIVSRSVLNKVKNKGANISLSKAKKICDYYSLSFDEYFVVKKDDVKGYSSETIKTYRRVLRTVFNEAVRFEWIEKNPVCATKIGAANSNVSLRPVNEKEVFSMKEAKEFIRRLDALGNDEINRKVVLKMLLLTGMRRAEMSGLKWSDIDFENKVVHIRRNRLYDAKTGHYEKSPKTKTSERDIPLADALIDDLLKYMDWFRLADKHFDEKLDEYYLAVNIDRTPLHSGTFVRWLKWYEATWGMKAVSVHGLRHTYCSLLLAQNVPVQTVSKYMGHSDSTVTLRVYSHFIPDTKDTAVNAISKIID